MSEYFHSVTLHADMCHGCITCVKRCPTEAIRVRNGKAQITKGRCIDFGECIRVCPHHAKHAITDPFETVSKYKYKIVLAPPSLSGQYKHQEDLELIRAALLRMGFDAVYEVAAAAELVSSMAAVPQACLPVTAAPAEEDGLDPQAFFTIGYGLYVLTARDGGKDNGCSINTLSQSTD